MNVPIDSEHFKRLQYVTKFLQHRFLNINVFSSKRYRTQNFCEISIISNRFTCVFLLVIFLLFFSGVGIFDQHARRHVPHKCAWHLNDFQFDICDLTLQFGLAIKRYVWKTKSHVLTRVNRCCSHMKPMHAMRQHKHSRCIFVCLIVYPFNCQTYAIVRWSECEKKKKRCQGIQIMEIFINFHNWMSLVNQAI